MGGDSGVTATWTVGVLIALLMLSPLAVGVVNRRFQKRERQPARGMNVGAHTLDSGEMVFLRGLARDVQTYQQTRKRKFVTGYAARVGETAIVCRTYRLGRQGAYVGVVDLDADAPVLEMRASPLHLLLRVIVAAIVAALALILDLPWWLMLIMVALVVWVFWFDHTNEKADLLLHLRTLAQPRAVSPARVVAAPKQKPR